MTFPTKLTAKQFPMELECNYLFFCWPDGVIPVALETVSREGYGFLLLVVEFDFCRVQPRVNFALNGESGLGCGVGDEVDDRLICFEGSSAPVLDDPGEESMLDLVPFVWYRAGSVRQ